jgi:hypothetical protein
MFLLYTDESGKSGLNDHLRQPFHVLGGVVVHDQRWQQVEADLMTRIEVLVPQPRPTKWELHMTDIWNGKRMFAATSRSTCEGLADAVIDVIETHRLKLFMMIVDKKAHIDRYITPTKPEFLTYEFMIERFDKFLNRQNDQVGLIVADDAKGQEDAIRRAHAQYRQGGTSQQTIAHVVETPFFVPSHYSVMLQIADVAAWWCARALRTDGRQIAWGPTTVPQWGRLRQHIDVAPSGQLVGFKVFP